MLNKLTPTKGESLVIWRRRKQLNQIDAARYYAVRPDTYRGWEADRRTHDQESYHAGELKPHETCYLLRRRAGKYQKDIATEMGISRQWVIQMEEGTAPVERLVAYWEAKQQCQS